MSNAYWEPLDFELPPVPDTAASGWERRIDIARKTPEDIIDPPAEQVVTGAGIAWRRARSRRCSCASKTAPAPGLEAEDKASQQTPRTHCASPDPDKQKNAGRMTSRGGILSGRCLMAILRAWQCVLRESRWPALMIGALIVAGCSTAARIPYTAAETAAVIPNMADVRIFADVPAPQFRLAVCANLNLFAAPSHAATPTYLALSGGGADGAYGAGVLNGWTDSGTRAEFTIVSGVSTGAMIAPFAFLGPSYDGVLRQLYTSGVAESLVASPRPLGMLFGSGLFGNQRLRELVAQYVDQPTLSRIASEYAKGRCLAVATTDLDAQRVVVWNMGRIASYGSPAALDLFRDVLIASASSPVIFPPVFIDAEANGRTIQEMHVDGAVTAPVFTLPAAFLLSNAQPEGRLQLNVYVLINSDIDPDFRVVPNRTADIAGKTVSTMIKDRFRSVIFRTYEFAQENRLGFNLTYIDEAGLDCGVEFDTACMRRLYQYGYQKALSGHFWQTSPPSPTPHIAAQRSPGRITSRVVRAPAAGWKIEVEDDIVTSSGNPFWVARLGLGVPAR